MKRSIQQTNNEEISTKKIIVHWLELPKEIWLHIAACCIVKNKLREICSFLSTIASRKNKEIFLHDQLNLSSNDLKRFTLYYADLGESLIIKNLLFHGADPNAMGDHTKSLMDYAILNGNTDIITMLINHSKITEPELSEGKNALEYITNKNEVNKNILSNLSISNAVALSFFAEQDNSTMIEHLLKSDISIHNKQSALAIATVNDSTDAIRTLLRHKISPNFIYTSFYGGPLHIAARRGYTNILKLFLENDAYIDIKDVNNCTPLHCAIQEGYINSVQFLIDNGACVTEKTGNKETALVLAIKSGYIKIMELLLPHVDINEKMPSGEVALSYAVRYNRMNIIKKLLTYPNLKINTPNNNGDTPLDIAFKIRYFVIGNLLLENNQQSYLSRHKK